MTLTVAALCVLIGCAPSVRPHRAAASPQLTGEALGDWSHPLFRIEAAPSRDLAAAAFEEGGVVVAEIEAVLGPVAAAEQARVCLYRLGAAAPRRLHGHDLSRGSPDGFTVRPARRICVVTADPLDRSSREVLRHELVHWVVLWRLGLPVDAEEAGVFREPMLPGVPWWLDEGLACVFEHRDALGVEPVAAQRQRQLRRVLRTLFPGRLAGTVLRQSRLKTFTSDDYALAWGLTYGLLTASELGLNDLQAYVQRFRQLRREQLEEVLRGPGQRSREEILTEWFHREPDASEQAFEELLRQHGDTTQEALRRLLRQARRR